VPEAGIVETPSGKGRSGENFPVGSWLIRRDLRVHVRAFYRFARNADDIADNPALAAEDKLRRLDRMAAVLDGAAGSDSPAASAMRASLAETGVTAEHCHDVLQAFRLDAVKLRYRDWDDLMGNSRYWAGRVGGQRSILQGEGPPTGPPPSPPPARISLPLADLDEAGCGIEMLAAPAASPGLRRVLDTMLDRTES